ncbi:Uncharacterised protein [Xylophilus ampelinus]|nr:Uncharacterised protein [Xylophilus ampelinus]
MRHFAHVTFPDGSTAEGFVVYEVWCVFIEDMANNGWQVRIEDVAA